MQVRRANEAIIDRIDGLGGPQAIARDPTVALEISSQLGLSPDELKKELAMHFEAVCAALYSAPHHSRIAGCRCALFLLSTLVVFLLV